MLKGCSMHAIGSVLNLLKTVEYVYCNTCSTPCFLALYPKRPSPTMLDMVYSFSLKMS